MPRVRLPFRQVHRPFPAPRRFSTLPARRIFLLGRGIVQPGKGKYKYDIRVLVSDYKIIRCLQYTYITFFAVVFMLVSDRRVYTPLASE